MLVEWDEKTRRDDGRGYKLKGCLSIGIGKGKQVTRWNQISYLSRGVHSEENGSQAQTRLGEHSVQGSFAGAITHTLNHSFMYFVIPPHNPMCGHRKWPPLGYVEETMLTQ